MTKTRDAHKSWMMTFFPRALGFWLKQEALHLPLYSKDNLFLLLRFDNFCISDAVVRNCSVKKSCLSPTTLLKKRLWRSCFAVNFVKFLRILFVIEHQWLLLAFASIEISYSNTVYNISAAETWICLVSFFSGKWWSERLSHVFSSE